MHEATTAELAEIFDVTKKTIALWSHQGIMVKLRHGVYDLKESLKNWAAYQKCIFEGADDPLLRWEIRRDIAYSEAHPIEAVDDLADLSTIIELDDPFSGMELWEGDVPDTLRRDSHERHVAARPQANGEAAIGKGTIDKGHR